MRRSLTADQDQPYTIQADDDPSKISQYFYGLAGHNQRIVSANNIADPDMVRAGQTIHLPALQPDPSGRSNSIKDRSVQLPTFTFNKH